MNKEKSIAALNTLIEIHNDRIEGYETAAKETIEQDLKKLFSQFSLSSKKCRQELVFEVHKLGGKPTAGLKTTGKIYRVWMDVKTALVGKDRQAILNSCEYAEDISVEAYNKTLKNYRDFLTPALQTLLNAQCSVVKADHDKVKVLREIILEHK